MSEEKKTYNGRVQFWERGFLGVKDFEDNVIISPDMHYSEIRETDGEDAAIVRKADKWALTDLDGKALCLFIYDRIVFIGEHCYKAGIYVKPDNGELIVEYADTRMTYAILDDKGNVLCDRSKGYNYISDVHEGEATTAINGRCGIIDLQGNIKMEFRYKYIQPLGEEHYLVSYDGEDNYYATIVDKQGNVMIPASKQYRSIYNFHNHVAVANQNGKWGLIDDSRNHIGNFEYNFAAEWGDGYYKVEKGSKKNIMRPDGSLVLQDWYNDVFKVSNGYFEFGNTIRKSKTNPKTRYVRGVAHVNSDILFPMIFEHVRRFEDSDAFYAEIGTKPYILTPSGGIYDPQGGHLQQKLDIDETSFFESLANWVLPGLQFFYRDTNSPIDAARIYRVGDTIRAGFFVDATTKLLKPAHRTRFLIASAHAARFFEVEQMVKDNPNIAKWNLATFHFNSFFKVMDVYETPLCTQVFLLHIPMSAAILLNSTTAFRFLDEATGSETSLVQMARKSLDEKLRMEFHDRSFDEEWCKRMEQPVEMSEDLTLYPVNPVPEPSDEHVANLSKLVHHLAEDSDIDYKTEVTDNFPWKGIEGRVCEGCIFAETIIGKGEGCDKLKKDEFRENYVKGICLHHKTKDQDESEFERREKRKAEEEKDKAEKTSDVYAIRLMKEFVAEKLDGDIDRLRDFDLSSLKEDPKYGDHDISRANIAKAIVSLVFGGDWPELTVDTLNHYDYRLEPICHYQNIFGANIMDVYFKGLKNFNPSEELHQRAVKCAHMTYNIGNLIVLPNKFNDKESLSNYRANTKFRSYMDKYLMALYNVMTEQKKPDIHLKGILYKNRKMMVDYQGDEDFIKFIHAMMLEPFIDNMGRPKSVFKGVRSYMKDLDRATYMEAVKEYIAFCNEFIPKRGERMIERIKQLIK